MRVFGIYFILPDLYLRALAYQMKYFDGLKFNAPFNVTAAMSWLYSVAPRERVPANMRWKKRLSIADVARLVRATPAQIRKMQLAAEDGPEAIAALSWGRTGRPLKQHALPRPNER